MELSCFSFDIAYRPGKDNIPADTFTRVYCSLISLSSLYELHKSLCHPGISRMTAFVRNRNLPFSVEDIRKMTSSCSICNECKPRFHKPEPAHIIKATQPFERLNLDFKGPLPSATNNKFILTVIDEFSRFPFAMPCSDIEAKTIIKKLCDLFSIFGTPAHVHSDRGQSFMSTDLRDFLHRRGIATSRTTPYNPQGNGQCERYNGTIWKTITLALKNHKLPSTYWEAMIPDALHSIRTLISVSTNCTPHERLFQYQRCSATGCNMPSWLSTLGQVLLKKHVRKSKYDPLVEEVELIEANPQYAHVRHPNGRETTVSIRHLAPRGDDYREFNSEQNINTQNFVQNSTTPDVLENDCETADITNDNVNENEQIIAETPPNTISDESEVTPILRRSVRIRRPPDRLDL